MIDMSAVPSITFDFPPFNGVGEQTKLSVGLRITALVVGTIVALTGILILAGIPGLHHLGTTVGWIFLSIGLVIAAAGASLKCVERQNDPVSPVVQNVPAPEPIVATDQHSPSQRQLSQFSSSIIPEELVLHILERSDNRTLSAFARTSKAHGVSIEKSFPERLRQAFFEEAAFETWVKSVEDLKNHDREDFFSGKYKGPFYCTNRFVQLLMKEYCEETLTLLKNVCKEIPKMRPGNDACGTFFSLLSQVAWMNPSRTKECVTAIIDSLSQDELRYWSLHALEAAAALGSEYALKLRTQWQCRCRTSDSAIIKAMAMEKNDKLLNFFKENTAFEHDFAMRSLIEGSLGHEKAHLLDLLNQCLPTVESFDPREKPRVLFEMGVGYLVVNAIDKAVEILNQVPRSLFYRDENVDYIVDRMEQYCDLKNSQFLPPLEVLNDYVKQDVRVQSYFNQVKIAHLVSKSDQKRPQGMLDKLLLINNLPETWKQKLWKMIVSCLSLFDPDAALKITEQMTLTRWKLEALVSIKKAAPALAKQIATSITKLREQVEAMPDGPYEKIECLCLLATYMPKQAANLMEKAHKALGRVDATLVARAYSVSNVKQCIEYVHTTFTDVCSQKVDVLCRVRAQNLNSLIFEGGGDEGGEVTLVRELL